MQVPVSNIANAFTIASEAIIVPGIKIQGLVPGGNMSALFLGDRSTGGWERFVRFDGKADAAPREQLFLRENKGTVLSVSAEGKSRDLIVLVRTGLNVKGTKVAQHGVYVPHGSDAERIDFGTIKRGGAVTSREELWLLPEESSIIVLTATGRTTKLANRFGKAFGSGVDMDELKELSVERVLDIVEQTIGKNVDGMLHWLISEASHNSDSFSQKSRERFRAIVTKYRDKANEGIHSRLNGLYKRFYDGRFGGKDDNVVSIGSGKSQERKGPSPAQVAKKAARSAKDQQRTIATKGKSPQPPQTHKKPKVG